ncbi:MAG: hypothetical protein R2838_17475 [Caldilineaceae bacterium]
MQTKRWPGAGLHRDAHAAAAGSRWTGCWRPVPLPRTRAQCRRHAGAARRRRSAAGDDGGPGLLVRLPGGVFLRGATSTPWSPA